MGLDLPPAWDAAETEKAWPGEANQGSNKSLVGSHESCRNIGHLEDGHQGRFGLGRQPVDGLCEPALGGVGPWGQNGVRVQVRLHELLEGLPGGVPGSEVATGAVSGQAFRSIHRPGQECPDSRGGQEERKLAEPAKRCPLRKGREAGSDLAEVGCGSSNGLPSSYARPSLSGDPSPWPIKKGAYFADLFAGSGRIGRAANALGFQTRSWELNYGRSQDLTDLRVLSKIKFDIRKRLVLGGMLAPPCLTFSVARDRAGVIRTRDFPWGLLGLSDRDQEKVSNGNNCMRSAFAIINELDSQCLPWIFEHPHSSKAWFLPELQRLQGLSHVQIVVTDFCQWGTKWRKRTRFLLGNIAEDDAEGCSRMCQGRHGFCSRTQTHLADRQGCMRTKLHTTCPTISASTMSSACACCAFKIHGGAIFVIFPPTQALVNYDSGVFNLGWWPTRSALAQHLEVRWAEQCCTMFSASLLRRAESFLRIMPLQKCESSHVSVKHVNVAALGCVSIIITSQDVLLTLPPALMRDSGRHVQHWPSILK